MPVIPVFTLPLIALMLLVPIFSIEGITPWIIFVFFTYKIIKTSNIKNIDNKTLVKKNILYFLICIVLGIIYNLLALQLTWLFVRYLI